MSESVLADLGSGLARCPVAGLDPYRFLEDVAREIARALDVAGAVFVVPATGWVRGSDETVTLLGETQQRDGRGPLSTALRNTHPIATPDLTRIGPPSLAALAGEVGLTSSTAVPVLVGDDVVAAVQVLGGIGQPVEEWHLDALAPVLPILGARIVDLTAICRLRESARRPSPQPRVDRPVPSDTPPPRTGSESRSDAGRPVPPRQPVRTPLSRAEPELVTQELRLSDADVVPLPRRESGLHAERPRSRRRREG